MLLRDIPEYRAALEKERLLRDIAILRHPSRVAGVDLRQITLRDYLTMSAIHCPYVVGGLRTPVDAVRLLVFLSVGYRPSGFRAWLNRVLVMAAVKRVGVDVMMRELEEWLDEIWMDAPGTCAAEGAGSSAPCVSTGITIIDKLATDYGWAPEIILDLSMPLIFQIYRARDISAGRKTIMFNKFSDQASKSHIQRLNAQRREATQ